MQLKPKPHQYMGMNWTKLFEKYVVQLCWSTEPSEKNDFIDHYRKSRSWQVVPIQEESHSDVESEEDDDDEIQKAKDMINAGFGVVNTHLHDGIIRGNGLIVALSPNSSNAYRILDQKSAQLHFHFY